VSSFLNGDRRPLLACRFTHSDLPDLRLMVAGQATCAGLAGMRWDDFVLAVHEGAVNAVGHGSGAAWMRLWRNGVMLCCEIRNAGLGGKQARSERRQDGTGGRGLWLISQLADEVTFTSGTAGTRLWIAFRLPS
jgi:anti-sigma regulatory factor (Ser/Thr protein kinase)